jgi:hypothetical protein
MVRITITISIAITASNPRIKLKNEVKNALSRPMQVSSP